MNNKVNKIGENMNVMIKDAINEHLFKYAEKDDLVDMLDTMFRNIHSKIDSLVGQPRMLNLLIDMDDDGTKHEIEEAFDLFRRRDDDYRAHGRAQCDVVRDGGSDGVQPCSSGCSQDGG